MGFKAFFVSIFVSNEDKILTFSVEIEDNTLRFERPRTRKLDVSKPILDLYEVSYTVHGSTKITVHGTGRS